MKGQPFKKFLGIVKQIAPTALVAMGQPVGAALLRQVLGGKDGDDVEKLVEGATLTPDGIERLKLAEIELQKFESEKGIRFAELDVADVQSARQHDIEMRKQGDRTTKQLAWLIVGAFVALSATVVFAALLGLGPVESTLVGSIIGYLLGEAKQVTAFYFGSSRGSKEKTELMGSK